MDLEGSLLSKASEMRFILTTPWALMLLILALPINEPEAKKPVKATTEEVVTATMKWLQGFLQEEDTRELLQEFSHVKGSITVDVTVWAKGNPAGLPFGRGRVQTVFFADTDIEDHRFNGRFKDLLRDQKFDWKMKKSEQVKVSYTFEIQ